MTWSKSTSVSLQNCSRKFWMWMYSFRSREWHGRKRWTATVLTNRIPVSVWNWWMWQRLWKTVNLLCSKGRLRTEEQSVVSTQKDREQCRVRRLTSWWHLQKISVPRDLLILQFRKMEPWNPLSPNLWQKKRWTIWLQQWTEKQEIYCSLRQTRTKLYGMFLEIYVWNWQNRWNFWTRISTISCGLQNSRCLSGAMSRIVIWQCITHSRCRWKKICSILIPSRAESVQKRTISS